MKRRSPTAEGFKAVFRHPALVIAEISWRWSFGFGATLLLAFSFFEYLDTLPVTSRDLVLLGTRQSWLIAQAMAHILRGSGPRLEYATIVLGLGLAMAWIAAASLGRAATVRAILNYLGPGDGTDAAPPSLGKQELGKQEREGNRPLRSLFALHLFRAATTIAAIVSCGAATLLGGAASPRNDPSPGSAFLVFLTLIMLVGLAWSFLNWFLSLATVLAVTDGQDAFGAMSAAVDLIRKHPGPVFAASTWFGLAHGVAFTIASSVIALPLAFTALLPPAAVFGGVLLVLLLYFAVADFLYTGRLAAYVIAILDQDLPRESIQPSAIRIQRPNIANLSSGWLPTEDDILSDTPSLESPS